ncbi:MAG: serine/threonine protein kinase, partial [Chloroflexi bacterium]|nr:serine/threonine protein kinase [Chloroflexota bacterium]
MKQKTVLGRYAIEEQIRGNGLAVNYRGRDQQTGQGVAVTVFESGLASAADFIRRFEEVAKAIAKIQSPHA